MTSEPFVILCLFQEKMVERKRIEHLLLIRVQRAVGRRFDARKCCVIANIQTFVDYQGFFYILIAFSEQTTVTRIDSKGDDVFVLSVGFKYKAAIYAQFDVPLKCWLGLLVTQDLPFSNATT